MIESRYWRSELKADIRWLRSKQVFKRWTEKQQVLYERRLMLVAFQIRSLLERPKVNEHAKAMKLPVIKYPKVGGNSFTVIGPGCLSDHFDLTSPEVVQLAVWDVCNQLIHYYWMSTASDRNSFTSVLVFSDYKRSVCAYEFDVNSLIELFAVFGDELSAVHECCFKWNEKKSDYMMINASGKDEGHCAVCGADYFP